MTDELKQQLANRNKNLIDMVIGRAKRDFSDDIALIGVKGSFHTNDFHEKSDLDLLVVNNNDNGWGMAYCFILDDVGYDIYCTSWNSLEQKSNLDSVDVSALTGSQILYWSKPEDLERFNKLKEKALNNLSKPIGKDCIARAKKNIDIAKQEYADMILADCVGSVRYASGGIIYYLINSIVCLNNTYFKRGTKRFIEEVLTYKYLPENFEKFYVSVIEAKTIEEIRVSAGLLLNAVIQLYDSMCQSFIEKPMPTYDNLKGTYEEFWSNYRNKVIYATSIKDKNYLFRVGIYAQAYLDEMTATRGTKKYDLMKHFDIDNIDKFQEAFLQIMDDYLLEYNKVSRPIECFNSFDTLYSAYMKNE
jgi:predicted nucleotidyltransferase